MTYKHPYPALVHFDTEKGRSYFLGPSNISDRVDFFGPIFFPFLGDHHCGMGGQKIGPAGLTHAVGGGPESGCFFGKKVKKTKKKKKTKSIEKTKSIWVPKN
jgi:hypothetical protein